mmetsp:Transcript_8701/g.17340  ORF Transcript_8701/g.17340 Transcript_8701/m.17340 type:complete len:107 (+) Transcript_8701:1439-1759(+)
MCLWLDMVDTSYILLKNIARVYIYINSACVSKCVSIPVPSINSHHQFPDSMNNSTLSCSTETGLRTILPCRKKLYRALPCMIFSPNLDQKHCQMLSPIQLQQQSTK